MSAPIARRSLRQHFVSVASFWVLASLCSWQLITLQDALVSDLERQPWTEWVYTARLSVWAAGLLGVPWTLLYALEQCLGRYAPASALLVLAAVFPLAHDLGRKLAGGEGTASLHLTVANLERAVTLVLCAAALIVWAFQRGRLRPAYDVLLAMLGVAGLLFFDHRYLRTYAILAPFVLCSALCVCTASLHRLLAARPGRLTRVSSAAFVLMGLLFAVGLVKPGWVIAGRSSVLADETSILALDELVFAGDIAAVQFDLELANKQVCAAPQPVSPWPPLSIPANKRRNVILISVDALRRDVVGKRVNGRSLTPNLDSFAAESWTAQHAYTTYPATLFALAGAVTGLLPSEILFAPVPPDSIFRMLQTRMPSGFVVLPVSSWFSQPAISKYVTQPVQRVWRPGAVSQTDEMLRRMTRLRATQPVLGWVHYLEPHEPYQSHPDLDFGSEPEQLYYSEVAFVDAQIGRLLAELRRGGWFEDSLILFFADHGEALGERKYFGHHVFLNAWISDIPFMLHVPELGAKSLAEPVSITDVAPTVLHFLEQQPTSRFSGQSLLAGPISPDRVVVSEAFPIRGKSLFDLANTPLTSVAELEARIELIQEGDRRYQPKVAMVRDGHRLIVRRTTGSAELYNVASDPSERHNLAGEQPGMVASLRSQLAAWHREQATRFYCSVRALPPLVPTMGPPLPPRAGPPTPKPRNIKPKWLKLRPTKQPSRASRPSVRENARRTRHPMRRPDRTQGHL